jgi:hypothetical protein
LVKNNLKIKCAFIQYSLGWDMDRSKVLLKINYSERDYNDFIKSLDFEYDNGVGGQVVFGLIWLEDDTWLSRGEYDGSEWWDHNILPTIPIECIN